MFQPFKKRDRRWPDDFGEPLTDPQYDKEPQNAGKRYRTGLEELKKSVKRLRSLLQVPQGDMKITWSAESEVYKSTAATLEALQGRLDSMERDLDRVDEIVALRIQDLDLQRRVLLNWPSDEVASVLLFIGLGSLSTGTALFAFLGFPGLSPKLGPPALFWGAAALFLIAGTFQLADSQSTKMHYFRTRMGIDSRPLERGAFGLTWIPVWLAIGAVVAAIIVFLVESLIH